MAQGQILLQTPIGRVIFNNIYQKAIFEGVEEKEYSVTIIFPKETSDFSELQKAVKQARINEFGNNKPKNYHSPFNDGNEKIDSWGDKMQDTIYCKFRTGLICPIVYPNRQPLVEQADFYAGCWARAIVSPYAWKYANKVGVRLTLQGLQKIRDDEPLGSMLSPWTLGQHFDEVEGADQEKDKESDSLFD